MAIYTSNLNLAKPEYEDDADIMVINDNFDIIDELVAPSTVAVYDTTFGSSGVSITEIEYSGWVVVEAEATAANARCTLQCGALKLSSVAFSQGDMIYLSLPIKVGQDLSVIGANIDEDSPVVIYQYSPVEPSAPNEEETETE